MSRVPLLLLLVSSLLVAQAPYWRLPGWAAAAAMAAKGESAPEGADAWVLLDRTEIAYVGSGEIRQRRFRLVQILTERGCSQGIFTLRGLGGKASKVRKLKGWNIRPDGELVKLDQDTVMTIHDAGTAEFSAETLTGAALDRVRAGSIVAFESLESVESPLGPVAGQGILETVPIRRWELEVAKKEGWFTDLKAVGIAMEKYHFQPWITQVEELPGSRLALSNLQALPKEEGGHPDLGGLLPQVRIRFLDPELGTARIWGSWDEVAKWGEGNYRSRRGPTAGMSRNWAKGLEGLKALHAWMGESLTYRQIYLTPERGWIPERSDEVGRKRYGDCKDMSCFLIAEASLLGFPGFPVLAAIGGPEVDPADSAFPVFNHVITALKLDQSLGLPAEVTTPKGRFLLVDPTDPMTPLGLLGEAHRGHQVMLCLEDGAQWVRVPDVAIQPNRLELELDGEATANGRLVATLRIAETGNAWNLRATARVKGLRGVQDRLVKDLLDLPPTGVVVVQRLGDPLELAKPFQVVVKVDHPQGFRLNGDEREVVGWGIPWPRPLIQKAGVPRRYPVEFRAAGERTLRGRLKVPGNLQPVASVRSGESAFCAFSWEAASERGEGGSILSLRFQHRWKDAAFGFDQREAGVQAWRRDRNAFKTFREEALAFKVLP